MKHTISILCDDTPGTMTRISGLFSRRGFNIESLSVGNTETPGKSRFTIVVSGDDAVLEQVRKQLQKLVHVIKVWDIAGEALVEREHALVKVRVPEGERDGLMRVITELRLRLVDSTEESWIVELTGTGAEVDSGINLLSRYGIAEAIRTGRVALGRGA